MVSQLDSTATIVGSSQRGQDAVLELLFVAAACRGRTLAGRRTPLEGPWVADIQHCGQISQPLAAAALSWLPTALGVHQLGPMSVLIAQHN